MNTIQIDKDKIIVSKWKREGEEDSRGVKLSITDGGTIATVFLSLDDCDRLMVALFKEKKEIREELNKK